MHYRSNKFINTFYYVLDNSDTQNSNDQETVPLDHELETAYKQTIDGCFESMSLLNQYIGIKINMEKMDGCFQNEEAKENIHVLYQKCDKLRKLRHKYIAQNYGIRDNNSIIKFKACGATGTIYHLIHSEGPLKKKDVSKNCKQILQGLAYLHKEEIVHRDIRCVNTVLDNCGNCKLTDFGISKDVKDLQSNSGFDAIYWMRPEVIQGEKDDFKSDIWSLGCTVLEMLNKEPLYGKLNVQDAKCKILNEYLVPDFPLEASNSCIVFTNALLKKKTKFRPSAAELFNFEFLLAKSEL